MQFLKSEIVKNKRVLMRVDFNVDLNEKGQIIDDFRIRQVIPTINFLINNQAKKIILISHLGRPSKEDQEKFSLKPVAEYLENLLNQKVYFINTVVDANLIQEIDDAPLGSIVMLENIRFYPEEEKNDDNFAKKLSELGDIYINEAFAVSHHQAASLCAITQFLPAYAGFLFQKEMESLDKIKNSNTDKLIIILGGAKIKDKLPLISCFINKAKYVLVGGALANTIIKSWDFEVGDSLVDFEALEDAKNLGSQKGELVIPGDYLVLTKEKHLITRGLGEAHKTDNILDIGPIAAKTFQKIILKAEVIFWNGPMGKVEDPRFREGTKVIINAIMQNKNARIVIGGGDTLKSLKMLQKERLPENIFLSTGGGATMTYLADQSLPGLIALK